MYASDDPGVSLTPPALVGWGGRSAFIGKFEIQFQIEILNELCTILQSVKGRSLFCTRSLSFGTTTSVFAIANAGSFPSHLVF